MAPAKSFLGDVPVTQSRRHISRPCRARAVVRCSISTNRREQPHEFHAAVAAPRFAPRPLRSPATPLPQTYAASSSLLESELGYFGHDYDGETGLSGAFALDRDGSSLGLEIADDSTVGDLVARVAQGVRALPAWQVTLALCCASNVVCATARGAMSVSVFPMSQLFGWTDSFTGTVSSAFFMGFTLSSLCGAYASTRLKPHMLTAAVVGTSAFTALTPLAAQLDPHRVATGISEGLLYPALQGLVSKHVPRENRAQGLGLCYSGAEMGNVVALTTSPALIDGLGWSANFHVYSMLGLGWLAAWGAHTGGKATEAPTTSPAATPRTTPASDTPVPWAQILSNRAYRATVISHCSYQFGNLVALSWLPTYFHQQYNADMCSSAALSITPWVVAIGATNLAAWSSDKFVSSGVLSATHTRKLMQTIASAGPAACILHLLLSSAQDTSCVEAMLTLSCMISLLQFKAGGYGPNFMDLSPKHASLLCGLSTSLAGV
eukprot:CAMPEP_0177766840 /NCGR_PEP_ID=MMETSP0491_2-20121128/8738_1 /TAXON_ID=63592 /ORGANISM="Tetraselmis chuii, Strain PLY429" /LENGTH=491 /DNA_ID=CAMNT_0019283279 /DNA_START=364 /DNA_END=1835 /DNA_ORIENTATION=-